MRSWFLLIIDNGNSISPFLKEIKISRYRLVVFKFEFKPRERNLQLGWLNFNCSHDNRNRDKYFSLPSNEIEFKELFSNKVCKVFTEKTISFDKWVSRQSLCVDVIMPPSHIILSRKLTLRGYTHPLQRSWSQRPRGFLRTGFLHRLMTKGRTEGRT